MFRISSFNDDVNACNIFFFYNMYLYTYIQQQPKKFNPTTTSEKYLLSLGIKNFSHHSDAQ